jgi:hypothetical protein
VASPLCAKLYEAQIARLLALSAYVHLSPSVEHVYSKSAPSMKPLLGVLVRRKETRGSLMLGLLHRCRISGAAVSASNDCLVDHNDSMIGTLAR